MNESEFEQELRNELRRVDAPAGFADQIMARVMARAAPPRKSRLMTIPAAMPRQPLWFAIAAMLLACIVLGGGQWRAQELRRERQQAEVARQQFEMAMQVTGRTLIDVQERIGHAGEVRTERRKREVEQ